MSKLTAERWFAPAYAWTLAEYERALRLAPCPPPPAPPSPVAAFIAAVGAPSKWHADALCREHPEVDWFPRADADADAGTAKAICARCEVRDDCLAAAGREHYGIWGATTERERRALRP